MESKEISNVYKKYMHWTPFGPNYASSIVDVTETIKKRSKYMKAINLIALAALIGFSSAGFLAAHDKHSQINQDKAKAIFLSPSDVKWRNGPNTLPPGLQMAIIEGNPQEEGPFTVRFKIPANYTLAPHTNPGVSHVTVLSGKMNIGTGEKFNQDNAKSLNAGSFIVVQPGTPNYSWTDGQETVLQVHGIGPWDTQYLNPQDDPRAQK